MSNASLPSFHPSCPSGGDWYACGNGTFFTGCCTAQPCDITCSQGNLEPTSFDADQWSKFPDASCGLGSDFWTCTYKGLGLAPFMGCCKSNPCKNRGCFGSNLTGAFLGTDDLRIAYDAFPAPSTSSSPTTLVTTSASATSTAKDAAALSSSKKEPVAAIAGGVVGGILGLAIIVGLLIYYFCYAKKSRKGDDETNPYLERQGDLPSMAAVPGESKGFKPRDEPPGYVSPNPNDFYGAHSNRTYQNYYHQYLPEPHELPNNSDPDDLSQQSYPKSAMRHQRAVSELSDVNAPVQELESPRITQNGAPNVSSPVSSPKSPTVSDWQSPDGTRGSNWVPSPSWQIQGREETIAEEPRGLGMQDTVAGANSTAVSLEGANVHGKGS